MTIVEAIKYAKDVCFCSGCNADMMYEHGREACKNCRHMQFFELILNVLERYQRDCTRCQHYSKDAIQYPCSICSRAYLDHFKEVQK